MRDTELQKCKFCLVYSLNSLQVIAWWDLGSLDLSTNSLTTNEIVYKVYLEVIVSHFNR